MTVFGTRPEAIKMAPVIKALEARQPRFRVQVAVTAQHREMLDQTLRHFSIAPEYDLNIMRPRQTLAQIATRALQGLDEVMAEAAPDLVLVHGDTATTFIGSLAAFYRRIPVGHVEAGLRTEDKYDPFPEEMNRRLTGVVADLHFAPTPWAEQNLLRERVKPETVFVTGNTAIDALFLTRREDYRFSDPRLQELDFAGKRVVVVDTLHRRENFGEKMVGIYRAVRRIAEESPEAHLVVLLHKNPEARDVALEVLEGLRGITLMEPLDYPDFINLIARAHMVISDSGGVQEEAPSLGAPVLLLRETTERPEALEAGTVRMVGTDPREIYSSARRLLADEAAYRMMREARNPYGDGRAAERIADALEHYFGWRSQPPEAFAKNSPSAAGDRPHLRE